MGTNWIPSGRTTFVALCEKWLDSLSNEAKVTAFMWMAASVTTLVDLLTTFLNAELRYTAADTTENRHAMYNARKALEKAMKEFARTNVRYNPRMTEADREAMGIFPPDTVHTPHPRPEALPRAEVEQAGNRQHRVSAVNPDTGKTGKPAGVHGVRFAWRVGGEKPASGSEIAHGKFSRKPEILITYDQTDVGKPARYACCYENAKGEAGPWSNVIEAYIN